MVKRFKFKGIEYEIDELGNVYGNNGNLIKSRKTADGYLTVTLGSKKEGRRTKRVHRLVAEYFVDNPLNKPEVNHIDGVKTNNHYSNLEWVTRKEQMEHASKMNLMENRTGTKNGRAVLTEKDIPIIKSMYKNGVKISEIAKTFSVGWTTISHVLRGDTWKHVSEQTVTTIRKE